METGREGGRERRRLSCAHKLFFPSLSLSLPETLQDPWCPEKEARKQTKREGKRERKNSVLVYAVSHVFRFPNRVQRITLEAKEKGERGREREREKAVTWHNTTQQ
jgi:hypothetical protein